MFIKDLVMWRHYNVILENSDITTRPWQRLTNSNNWNHLSAYLSIWNTSVLDIKGKVNKLAIKWTHCLLGHYISPSNTIGTKFPQEKKIIH
jgi:hypothetical protein